MVVIIGCYWWLLVVIGCYWLLCQYGCYWLLLVVNGGYYCIGGLMSTVIADGDYWLCFVPLAVNGCYWLFNCRGRRRG